MTATSTMPASTRIKESEIEAGDVFSEISHYTFINKDRGGLKFKHHESGQTVTLDTKYVENLLSTSDQYHKEEVVGKEDKKDGTPGIRTIWENIYSSEVFTVCFKKQDTPLSAKKLNELKSDQINSVLLTIEKAQKGKSGVLAAAEKALIAIQNNPILPYEEGEERVLRGYKVQFASRDGKYDCIDMDLTEVNNLRPVNINTIVYLIYKGVRYTVK